MDRRTFLGGALALPAWVTLRGGSEETAMITIRPSSARGHADHGWLDSQHTFSFANYYDPRHMGFGHLRVINQDRVAPGRGFGTHPHRNMEIVSYVVDGVLEHRDTLGTHGVIRPGEVQRMTAGRGIQHSEMNGSKTEPVHFLQIWLLPREGGTDPGYAQKDFGRDPGLQLVISPDGRDGSLTIGQDVDMWRALLEDGQEATLELRRSRAWVQVVKGTLALEGAMLRPGDGASVTDASTLRLEADGPVEALIFDLQ